MRKTEVPEEDHEFYTSSVIQEKLDAFWNLIEEEYDEEWRVQFNGTCVLVVDDEMLERILHDNVAIAWFKFGSNRGGWDENDRRYFTSRPEYLKGLYSIEGIYNDKQTYIGGTRTYKFERE